MIFVPKVDAAVPGSEHLHAGSDLGRKVKLSGAEHLPVKIEKTSATRKKWLDPMVVKEIDLCTDGTPAGTMGIQTLAVRLRIAYQRQRNYLGNVA
jgi:hypothetical protein